jgi:hypothetical protein
MYCYACRKAGPDIAGKTKFVTGKKLKRESPVYHNKTKSLKYEKCFKLESSMSHKNSYISMRLENSDFETSWNLRFSALEPELSSVFWLILPSMLHQAGQFHNQLIQPVLFFANRGR